MPALSLHTFIISWPGQHLRAVAIARAIQVSGATVSIVYSDPDPSIAPEGECALIRRPNELFFTDKFCACLEACSADLMLVIHADCSCADWAGLVARCYAQMNRNRHIGVWAPLVTGTWFDLPMVRIAELAPSTLAVVANTDAIVFCLARPVQERMRRVDYADNVYGWGICALFLAFVFSHRMYAVIDSSFSVDHPPGSGYDTQAASQQKIAMLRKLPEHEAIMNVLLQTHVEQNRRKNRPMLTAPPAGV